MRAYRPSLGDGEDPDQTVALGAVGGAELGDSVGELLQRAEVGDAAAGAAIDVQEVDEQGEVDGLVERAVGRLAEGVVEARRFGGAEADGAGVGADLAQHLEEGPAQAVGEGESSEAAGQVLDAGLDFGGREGGGDEGRVERRVVRDEGFVGHVYPRGSCAG